MFQQFLANLMYGRTVQWKLYGCIISYLTKYDTIQSSFINDNWTIHFECGNICHPCHIIYGQEQMNTDEVFKQFFFMIWIDS